MRQKLRELPALRGPLPVFEPDAAPNEPVSLFGCWLDEAVAAGVPEPHAMTVSTVDQQGEPSGRVVILKGVDETGWSFASSRDSAKGTDLAHRPAAALTFYWPIQGRQIRVRGAVSVGSPEQNAADFLARHPYSRAVVFSGRQSTPLASRQALIEALAAAQQGMSANPERIAPEWTVYTVRADRVEFWQGHPCRLHTRLSYRRVSDTEWQRELLWP